MLLAQRALREDRVPISQIALSLGYASESAFSNAFKRATGSAPRHYRHAARELAPGAADGGTTALLSGDSTRAARKLTGEDTISSM